MKIVERTTYPGWHTFPVYRCRSHDDYLEVSAWMRANEVESFMLSTSSSGEYIFQVKSNHEWFVLRWI
jgi:hypothetical protein